MRKMKTVQKTIILILVIGFSASQALMAQHRGMMSRHDMRTDTAAMNNKMLMWKNYDSTGMHMMRNHMRNMMRMHEEMWSGPRWHDGFGMRHAYAWGPDRDFGGFRPGFNHPGMLRSIPDLTDKQKKEIADLRQKHMDEMTKFREETQAKMNEMRDSFRKEIKNLLTDDQKKYFDDNQPEPPAKK
jgi:hypothetical protein